MSKPLGKKLFIIGGIIIFIIIAIIVVLMIINRDKSLSFIQIEEKMKKAAIKYYKDNSQLLPTENSSKSIVSGYELEQGYMKPISTMTEEGITCNGEVRVLKNSDKYLYIPYLNCGEAHETKELYKIITDVSNVVEQGSGLYKINNDYIFRGEDVNNFVKFSDRLWRIIKVDADNNIKLIEIDSKNKSIWDNRYNIDRKGSVGINNYENLETEDSRIKQYLNQLFFEKNFINESEFALVDYKKLCVGARSEAEKNLDGQVECSTLSSEQPIGLLTANEFLQASLDKNCNNTYASSCSNYNYLKSLSNNWWLLTASSKNTHQVYKVSGSISTSNASSTATVRPTIYLNSNVVYISGSGTEANPYIVKS